MKIKNLNLHIELLALTLALCTNPAWAGDRGVNNNIKPILDPTPGYAELLGGYSQYLYLGVPWSPVDDIAPLPMSPRGGFLGGAGSPEDPEIYISAARPGDGFSFPAGSKILLAPNFSFLLGYTDGSRDWMDPGVWFTATKELEVKLDGKVILDKSNMTQFYVESTYYETPVPISFDFDPTINSVAGYAGYCLLLPQLPLGAHTIETTAKFEFPPGTWQYIPGPYCFVIDDKVILVIKPANAKTGN